MSLDGALSIARSGLSAVSRSLSQSAQNIGNAETPGYTRKTVPQNSVAYVDRPGGVRTDEAQRTVDAALVARLDQARSGEAAAALRERLLGRIETAQGTPADATTLADGIGALENAFTALSASPSDAGLQRAALDAAGELARRFGALSAAVGSARQEAQDTIVDSVADANNSLREIADLTARLKSGVDGITAEIDDQRDAAVARLSEVLEVRAIRQDNGDLTLIGRGVVILPLNRASGALAANDATVAAEAFYGSGGALPGVTLNGVDITTQLRGGRLAEAITLRDEILPRIQAEIDLAAATLAQRLEAQGLRLFTDTDATVPVAGAPYAASQTVGFAGRIQVSDTLAADPAGLRDGTHSVTGNPLGATNFTPNPAGGPAGFTALLDRVLEFGFGTEAATGTNWAAITAAGLGPDGTLSSPFLPPLGIEDYAARLTGLYAADRASATAERDGQATLRAALETRFATDSGVDIDTELARMVTLQNLYAANARVMSTVQAAWDTLLDSVR